VPTGIAEYFLPNNLTFTQSLQTAFEQQGQPFPQEARSLGLLYRPLILAQANARFLNRSYDLDTELVLAALVSNPDRRGVVRWENYPSAALPPEFLEDHPAPEARFSSLELPLSDAKIVRTMERDFTDWAFREARLTVRANEQLKVFAGPDTSQADFRKACSQAAREGRDEEAEKVEVAYNTKIERLQERLEREQRELDQDESDLSSRKWEEMGTHAENLFGLFGKRRRSLSTSLTKRRMTSKASADVKESRETIKALQAEIAELEQEKAQALEEVNRKWSEIADDEKEITVSALKKDVLLEQFGVAWAPYYLAQAGEQTLELPGYQMG
jgi:hypothetical protein